MPSKKKSSAPRTPDRFRSWKLPRIQEGRLTRWNWMVRHANRLRLGKKTDIGAFTYINAHSGVTIEDDVEIGSHTSIYSLSTIDGKHGPVVLKKNCKIGSHSVIMPGITIGENTIVGAFSFVNKDLPKNSIAWGIPAKVRKTIPSSP